jgi:hypothetical protein
LGRLVTDISEPAVGCGWIIINMVTALSIRSLPEPKLIMYFATFIGYPFLLTVCNSKPFSSQPCPPSLLPRGRILIDWQAIVFSVSRFVWCTPTPNLLLMLSPSSFLKTSFIFCHLSEQLRRRQPQKPPTPHPHPQ